MELHKIFMLLLLVTLVASKKAHRRKSEKKHFLKEVSTEKDVMDLLRDDELNEERKLNLENEMLLVPFESHKAAEDPCATHKCGPGKQCGIDINGKAQCECITKCPEDKDPRRMVCSNHNETWDSDCELYQMRCYCVEEVDECKSHKYKHVHIDYYGSCKDLGECGPAELEDFPRRMRDWLFNIMQELARRDELHGDALKMEKAAEKTSDRKWVNAVIWKFCDLDVHPHDRHVSRHELFPIRAPLMAMEHCVAPFLDSCDANDDHKITLLEWGNCLGLQENEIQDKCVTMHKG